MMAALILAVHVGIILFNVFGVVAIPLGFWLGWRFVRVAWWRVLHVLSLAAVAGQAALGRACFLTTWQDQASGFADRTPLIMRWVNALVFWPIPLWVFAVAYAAVFVFVLALFVLVPPRLPIRRATGRA